MKFHIKKKKEKKKQNKISINLLGIYIYIIMSFLEDLFGGGGSHQQVRFAPGCTNDQKQVFNMLKPHPAILVDRVCCKSIPLHFHIFLFIFIFIYSFIHIYIYNEIIIKKKKKKKRLFFQT